MSFITPAYLIFLLIVWPIYWSLERRGQNIFILLASFFFYGWWDWRFLALLVTTTGIDYGVALAMSALKAATHDARGCWYRWSLTLASFVSLNKTSTSSRSR